MEKKKPNEFCSQCICFVLLLYVVMVSIGAEVGYCTACTPAHNGYEYIVIVLSICY